MRGGRWRRHGEDLLGWCARLGWEDPQGQNRIDAKVKDQALQQIGGARHGPDVGGYHIYVECGVRDLGLSPTRQAY